jgi:hypothetical protein
LGRVRRRVDLRVPAGILLGLRRHRDAGKTDHDRILTTPPAPTIDVAIVAGSTAVTGQA